MGVVDHPPPQAFTGEGHAAFDGFGAVDVVDCSTRFGRARITARRHDHRHGRLVRQRDLADPAELLSLYEPLGVEAIVTGPGEDDPGVELLRQRLADRTSVLFGQSGVGKSTLVNRLVPDAFRAVGDVTGVGKGRHTSSSAIALPLPGGGTVVDTPGIRSFGLGAVTAERVLAAFPDLVEGAQQCPPGCTHLEGVIGCALDGWAEQGRASTARLVSLRRLLAALAAQDD